MIITCAIFLGRSLAPLERKKPVGAMRQINVPNNEPVTESTISTDHRKIKTEEVDFKGVSKSGNFVRL